MSKTTFIAVLAAMALAGCGRSGGDAPAPAPAEPPAEDALTKRMNDKEYVAKLDRQHDEQVDIMKKIEQAEAALAKAEAAGASAEALATLSNAVQRCFDELERNRTTSQRIVREQLVKDLGSEEQATKAFNKRKETQK